MKNLLLILFIALLFGCKSVEQNWTTIEISGKIENEKIKNIIFYPIETIANDNSNIQEIPLRENGNFVINYALNKPVNALMVIGEKRFMFFLDKKNNLSFIIKEDSSIEILNDNEKNNSVFLEYQAKFFPFFESKLNYNLEPTKFALQLDSITDEKIKFLESNKDKISDDLITYIKNDISYYSPKEKIYYARRFASDLIKEENNYFDFLKSIEIENNQATNVLNYHIFIDNYINYLYVKKATGVGVEYKNDYVEKYYIAKSELNGEALEQFLTENLALGLKSSIINKKFLELVDEFISGNYSEKSKNVLKQNLAAFNGSSLKEGKNAPDFSLKSIENELYSLSDFTKDYIVLDFWASWCGPCRRAIPQMKVLSERYKDITEVVFVSVDSNIDDWEKASKQLDLPEFSLIIDSLSRVNYEFDKNFSVPHYMVIDKNGEIILNNTTVKKIELFFSNIIE